MRLNRFSLLALSALLGLGAILLTACSSKEGPSVDIPEGAATLTLKEFARQADVEILFDRQVVHDVKTNAIKGQYEPGYALRMMLLDTPLRIDYEKDSGAYAVYRKPL